MIFKTIIEPSVFDASNNINDTQLIYLLKGILENGIILYDKNDKFLDETKNYFSENLEYEINPKVRMLYEDILKNNLAIKIFSSKNRTFLDYINLLKKEKEIDCVIGINNYDLCINDYLTSDFENQRRSSYSTLDTGNIDYEQIKKIDIF